MDKERSRHGKGKGKAKKARSNVTEDKATAPKATKKRINSNPDKNKGKKKQKRGGQILKEQESYSFEVSQTNSVTDAMQPSTSQGAKMPVSKFYFSVVQYKAYLNENFSNIEEDEQLTLGHVLCKFNLLMEEAFKKKKPVDVDKELTPFIIEKIAKTGAEPPDPETVIENIQKIKNLDEDNQKHLNITKWTTAINDMAVNFIDWVSGKCKKKSEIKVLQRRLKELQKKRDEAEEKALQATKETNDLNEEILELQNEISQQEKNLKDKN